jgi:hypothetical protein
MAQKTIVQLIDDLDGSTDGDIESVQFSLDGVNYEIDLNEENAASLRGELERFIGSARRTGGRIRRNAPGAKSGDARSREETKAIRDWAKANGHDVSERGRLSSTIVEAYEAAQAAPKAKAKGRGRAKTAFSG